MSSSKETQKICQMILQNEKPLIKEEDLRNLTSSENFPEQIREVVQLLNDLGFSLSRTTFQGEKYFVLTAPGKDERVSPTMYGILVATVALISEVGDNVEFREFQRIFKDVWADVESLLGINYLAEFDEDGEKRITVTPLGKAVCRNIAKDIKLRNILGLDQKPNED